MVDTKAVECQVKRAFSLYYEDACQTVLSERPQDPRRIYFLRPSSFPYCGLRRLLDWPKTLEDDGKAYLDSGAYFYVTVGTAFHNIFQEVLGKHGQLIGDWKCPSCKDVQTFTTYSRCKACDRTRRYEELKVTHKKTLIGHVDGLFYEKKTKTYWVIDYKSTSSRKIWFHQKRRSSEFPYLANISQISSYVPLLELKYDIKITGYILVYLPRDNPMGAKVLCAKRLGPKAKTRELDRLNHYIKIHRKVLRAKTTDDLDTIYEGKLCSSKKDYDQNHHNKYSPCPHVDYCFSKSKMLSVSSGLLGKKIYPILKHAPQEIQKELGLSSTDKA